MSDGTKTIEMQSKMMLPADCEFHVLPEVKDALAAKLQAYHDRLILGAMWPPHEFPNPDLLRMSEDRIRRILGR